MGLIRRDGVQKRESQTYTYLILMLLHNRNKASGC